MSDSDDTDAQTTSSHPESGDAIVCNDEAVILETNDGYYPGNSSIHLSSKFIWGPFLKSADG